MKIKRHKQVRKVCQFYKLTFGFRPPYRIIVDGEFIQAALEGRIQIQEQLPKLFHAPAKAFVTTCILRELQSKGRKYSGAVHIAKTLPFLKCRHKRKKSKKERQLNKEKVVSEQAVDPDVDVPDLDPEQRRKVQKKLARENELNLPACECIRLLIENGNPDFLCVGAQNRKLRQVVRATPGVPVLHIHGQVPVLEQPSRQNQRAARTQVAEKSSLREDEQALLAAVAPDAVKKKKQQNAAPGPKRKKKKKKEPNPLSMKKKKKKPPQKKKKKKPQESQAGAAAAAAGKAQSNKGAKRKRTDSSSEAPAKEKRHKREKPAKAKSL